MILKILLVFGLIVAGLLIYAALKKPQLTIAREISIKSNLDKIFPYLNNSQKMNDWMPWKDADPGVNIIYSGPQEGVGSRSSWDSTGKMGVGHAEIIESIENRIVKTKLEYTKPMVMSQIAIMSLTPSHNGDVTVRWSVDGHNSFLFRLMGIFMNMDKMIGGEFDKGLVKLKNIVETEK